MLPQMSFLQIKMLGVRDVEVRAIDELVLMNYHFDSSVLLLSVWRFLLSLFHLAVNVV